jgi:hypothetical protein
MATVTMQLSIEDRLKIQRERVQRAEFLPLGKLITVVLEPARDANLPPRDQTKVWGVRLDWMGMGPMLGLSLDQQDLLITTPVPPLPKIVDPQWKPTDSVEPPYISQPLEERASGRLRGTNFVVLQPVAQILYRMAGNPAFRMISGQAGADGTHLALLIDPSSGQGHFYGGRFIIL